MYHILESLQTPITIIHDSKNKPAMDSSSKTKSENVTY